MIVNKKSYPTLEDISKNKLTSIKFMDIDSTYSKSLGRSFFEEQWGRHARMFGKEVLVVSKAYEEASIHASDTLYQLVESIRE